MPAELRADFSGKTVLVTGAGRGLGLAYARAFAAAGAAVAVNDIDTAASEAALGPVDILINNAALYAGLGRKRFDKILVEEWRRVIDVNVTGSYLCARAVLPHMLERRWGRIVNVSSSTVPLGRPGFTHYVTSKAAILGMTRAMARELGAENITVNAVMPGLTETEGSAGTADALWEVILRGQSIPRREQPQDVVGAVLFLASDAASFITGQTLVVDGGSAHL